jgi:integrase
MSEREKLHGVVLIYQPAEEYLNPRQRIAYREHRKDYINWLATEGKDPEALAGYAEDTYYTYANIACCFHRFVWDREGFTLSPDHSHADAYLRALKTDDSDYSQTHLNNTKLALKAYFRFRDDPWKCNITIPSSSTAQPRDFLTENERSAIREAVLEYGSVPAYGGLSPEQRTKWKRHLSARFGKPMKEVGPADFKRANGWKYVSIVYASLDAGLRPIEVGRARTSWVDHENSVLRIPMDQSAKNRDNWTVSITDETAMYLRRWLEERPLYEKYEDTDRLWLTRHENPYRGKALKALLDNLCDIAGIERDLSWYAIRHSTGTYMSREGGLAYAKDQLRHKRIETTSKYDQAPPDERRNALDRMG